MSSDTQNLQVTPDPLEFQRPNPPGENPAPPPKKGMGKAIAIIAVVAIVVIAVIAVAMLNTSPGIVGRWNVTSVKTTIISGGISHVFWDNSTGNWAEFKSDGTGINSDGETFTWETSGEFQISFTGEAFGSSSIPFNYDIAGDVLTLRGNMDTNTYVVMTLERA